MLMLAEYDVFKKDCLSATNSPKQSLRNICSSKIPVTKCTNVLGIVMTTVYVMSKKACGFLATSFSCCTSPQRRYKKRGHFPHIDHKKKRIYQQKRLKRGHTVTDVVNIISSQRFSADISLNFMGMKCGEDFLQACFARSSRYSEFPSRSFPRHS